MTRAIRGLNKLFPDKIVIKISKYPSIYYDLMREATAKGKTIKEYLLENGFVYGRDATILTLEQEVKLVLDEVSLSSVDRNILTDNGIYQHLIQITNFYDVSIKEYLGEMGIEYNRQNSFSHIDINLANLLRFEYSVTLKHVGEIFSVSKQRVDQVLRKNAENNQDFRTDELGSSKEVFLSMIKNHSFNAVLGNSEYWIFNNLQKNVCLVWVDDDCHYCTKEDLPHDIIVALEEEKMDYFSTVDYEVLNTLSNVSVLKRNCAKCSDMKLYQKGCRKHKLNVSEYAQFLGFEGFVSPEKVTNTDARIVAFLEDNIIDGEVYISSDSHNQWIKQFASRNNMSIDELVEFYGYRKAPRNKYAELDRYLENEKQKMIEDLSAIADNLRYVQPQGNLYYRLYTFARRRNLHINDLIENLGFHRKYGRVPDEIIVNKNVVKYALEDLRKDINQELHNQKSFAGTEEENRKQIVRNAQLVARLKNAYGCKCQLCNDEEWMPIEKTDGSFYSEVHHIIPLAEGQSEEETLDTLDNMIVVCPNHHKVLHFHHGGYRNIVKKDGQLFFFNGENDRIPIVRNYHLDEKIGPVE